MMKDLSSYRIIDLLESGASFFVKKVAEKDTEKDTETIQKKIQYTPRTA